MSNQLEKTITSAWQQQSLWLWLLLPLMLLYWLGHSIHKGLYKFGIKKTYQASVPVIVIGNITVGGSGKTPLLISMVKYLTANDVNVAVISRGYVKNQKNTVQDSQLVTKQSDVSAVGDEPSLIVQETNVPVCVGKNRQQSIEKILETYPDTAYILCDDGLQHYRIKQDKAFVVFDVKRGLGNKMLLPVGFLREWSGRLTKPHAQDVVVEHVESASDASSDYYFHLNAGNIYPLFQQKLDVSFDDVAHNRCIHAVTGIGYPIRFQRTLENLGYEVLLHSYPDHHNFKVDDFIHNAKFKNDLPIIMTSKDAVKVARLDLPNSMQQRIWVLPVNATLSDGLTAELDSLIRVTS